MATETQRPQQVDDLDCPVVDADFHLTEQVSDLIPYVERPWRELFIGHNPFDEDANYYDPFPSSGVMEPHITTGRAEIFSPDAVRSADDVIEGMELLGIDYPLVTPGAVMLSLGLVHHDEVAAALAHACNTFVLDQIVDEARDVLATITVAGQKPRLAADEIDDRRHESGMVGVYLPTGGLNPPLGDERYDPIYEACERAGFPLLMHGVGSGTMKSFPVQYEGFSRGMENHVIAHPFQHIVNVVSMVTHGVPERFDVPFVFQEAGIGWVPYLMERMDNEYYSRRDDAPMLQAPPSTYMREHFYYTSQPLEGTQNSPEYVCAMARLMGAEDCLMWSSDYPHHDFDHTADIYRVFAREFDRPVLENVFGNTAYEVFFD